MSSASQISPLRRRVLFSLGSNSGDREAYLARACELLCGAFPGMRFSRRYETAPVDCPPGSPPFLNMCAEVESDMAAEEILSLCQEIENKLGRRRTGEYGAARTCDIDLICCGDEVVNTPALVLPHPRAHLRRFVLQPLCDLAPTLLLPGQRQTAAQLLAALPESPTVTLYPPQS